MRNIIIQCVQKSRLLASLCCAGAIGLALTLGGCGKKPGSVDPPPWVENDVYPVTYPDTSLDPKPTWSPEAAQPAEPKSEQKQ